MSMYSQAEQEFAKLHKDLADKGLRIMRNEIPIGKTHALYDASKIEKRPSGFHVYRVGIDSGQLASDPRNASRTDYSNIVISGHRSFRLVPKRAQALHWIDNNGNDRFAKWIEIPAKPPNDFLKRTISQL